MEKNMDTILSLALWYSICQKYLWAYVFRDENYLTGLLCTLFLYVYIIFIDLTFGF